MIDGYCSVCGKDLLIWILEQKKMTFEPCQGSAVQQIASSCSNFKWCNNMQDSFIQKNMSTLGLNKLKCHLDWKAFVKPC